MSIPEQNSKLYWWENREKYSTTLKAKFQGSVFFFPSLNQNINVVVFPSNFWFQKFKVVEHYREI